jgi:hypothetical protein
MEGTYTSPNSTTGRFTTQTWLSAYPAIVANRAAYAVSSWEFLELTTDPLAGVGYSILIGKAQAQSGTLSLGSAGSNLVYYASAMESGGSGGEVELGLVTANNSSGTFTANVYEDNAGTWASPNPQTPSCSFSVGAMGRVTTSGASCTTYLTSSSTMYPPVFYLTGPNTGVMLGTEPAVLIGQLEPQSATSITAGSYYFGTQEAVNLGVETEAGVATLSSGAVNGTSDYTSTSSPQQANQSLSETLTVNSDGTISSSNHAGIISGIIISDSQIVIVDNQGSAYPTILIINAIPIS